MIIDLRTYTLRAGAFTSYVDRYTAEGFLIHTEYVGAPLGYYFSEVGSLNQIVHLWAFENMAERENRRAALDRDPGWVAYKQHMWESGEVVAQENKLLRAVDLPQASAKRPLDSLWGLIPPR